MPALRLREKVIVVTGSTTGIGKAIAKRCLEEGASVIIHGIELDLAEKVSTDLDPERERTEISTADLADPDAPRVIREITLGRFGKIDGLVNNAACVGSGNVISTSREDFDRFLEVNTKAPFFLIQELLDDLRVTKGSVVNIGSVNAYCGEPDLLPYSISKGALMTLTRNLGDVLHRQYSVRVNQVNPGWILTENEQIRKREQGLPEDWPKRLSDQFAPSGRIFDPAEIAAVVIYLLAAESGPVSGSIFDIEQHPMIGRNPPKEIEN